MKKTPVGSWLTCLLLFACSAPIEAPPQKASSDLGGTS